MPPRTADEILRAMQAQLQILDEDIDTSTPLTIERKILETVADIGAESQGDQLTLSSQFDINTKVGSDLDTFLKLFSFGRQQGARATGTVRFSRASAAVTDIVIPIGTQIIKPGTTGSPTPIIFSTTNTVTLYTGTTYVDAPIQAVNIGTQGNVAANTIVSLNNALVTDVTDVTNALATDGGIDAEDDASYRVRFTNTFLRNIAGTNDQYLALAIASIFANKANVVGPISRFIEYIQIQSGSPPHFTSQIPYSKYTYPFNYYLTNGDPAGEVFYIPNGVDYTFTNSVPPTVITNTTTLPAGSVVLFEHSYCSISSRNDPANNIANYVDVFVSGENLRTVDSESTLFPDSTNNFNTTVGSGTNISNFVRVTTGDLPAVGSRFQQLLWQPVTDLPAIITINNTDYQQGLHYYLVRDTTSYQGSKLARNGIEWSSVVTSVVDVGTAFLINYTYNKLPLALNQLMDAHKQVTADVLVHAANKRYFVLNLVVMYDPGASKAIVDNNIYQAVSDYINKLSFGAVIQVSDLLEISHEVDSVDNVRLATPSDGVAYGIQEIIVNDITSPVTMIPIGSPLMSDFTLLDSDLAVVQAVVTTQRTQNTWITGV